MTTKIQWKKLRTHDGSAAEVPALVTALLSGDAEKYTIELEELFINEGQTCSAAGPTIGLLLDQLSAAKHPEWALRAVANIAGGDWLYSWLREPNAVPQDVAQTLHERRAHLWDALSHEEPKVRSAAAFVLGGAPSSIAGEASDRLAAMLVAEREPRVLASCLLAIARIGATSTVNGDVERFALATDLIVRGAWGVAQLRMGRSISDESVAKAIIDWLSLGASVSPKEFWWVAPTVRFAPFNTAFKRARQDGIILGEMAKSGFGAPFETWRAFMLSVPTRTDEGGAFRGAGDFLRYTHDTLQIEHRDIMTPDQLTPPQRALAQGLEQSPLCPEGGHGFPACGAVRSRWLGASAPSVLERLLVETKAGVDGNPSKVPLYWAKSRRILGKPEIPELDALSGFEKWRVLVSEAFGEYSPNWVPPTMAEIDACVEAACADPRMEEEITPIADECAARLQEFRRQGLTPKYWAISALLLVRPLHKHGVAWKPTWQSLISMDGEPEAWVRELIAWIPPDIREQWLWDNLVRMRFEVHYVDLLPSSRLVKRSLLSIHNTRKTGRQPLASTLQLEQAIHELAKTNPVFAQAVQELQDEVGAS